MAPAQAAVAEPRRSAHERPVPGRAPSHERDDLRLLSPAGKQLRARRRQSRILIGMSVAVVAAALALVAAANSLVAAQQMQVDSLQQSVTSAVAQNQALQLQKSQLEAPDRILSIAEHELGMVTPKKVTYLTPVTLTGPRSTSAGRVRAGASGKG